MNDNIDLTTYTFREEGHYKFKNSEYTSFNEVEFELNGNLESIIEKFVEFLICCGYTEESIDKFIK